MGVFGLKEKYTLKHQKAGQNEVWLCLVVHLLLFSQDDLNSRLHFTYCSGYKMAVVCNWQIFLTGFINIKGEKHNKRGSNIKFFTDNSLKQDAM